MIATETTEQMAAVRSSQRPNDRRSHEQKGLSAARSANSTGMGLLAGEQAPGTTLR
jgi:hypothetical protein